MFKLDNKAFTLIEMAIVLTIIALLVAAIVGGRNMLETAKLNAVVSDLKNYKIAYDKFKEIYNAIPGDAVDGEDLFGSDCNSCGGNGDGRIANNLTFADLGGNQYENLVAWQQLYFAKLVDGKYEGLNTTRTAVAGDTMPGGPHVNSVYDMYYVNSASISIEADLYPHNANSVIYAGPVSGESYARNALLNPKDVYVIDTKMDDGMPYTGVVVAFRGADSGSECARERSVGASYATEKPGAKICSIVYFLERT